MLKNLYNRKPYDDSYDDYSGIDVVKLLNDCVNREFLESFRKAMHKRCMDEYVKPHKDGLQFIKNTKNRKDYKPECIGLFDAPTTELFFWSPWEDMCVSTGDECQKLSVSDSMCDDDSMIF